MKLDLSFFRQKYATLSNVEFEKIVSNAEALNKELISILKDEARKRNKSYFILDKLEKEYKQEGFPDYFSSIENQDIKECVLFLKKNLPKKCTKNNYQLTHKILGAQFNITQGIQGKLQMIADLMREHLEIYEPIKIITLNNIDAGKFEMIDNLNCIFINGVIGVQDFYQKVAILAHEMSHFYLMRKHYIIKPIEKENELLTEINAIYIGFGFLLLKGYKVNENKTKNRITKSKVGYINQKTIKEAIIETAYSRKQKPQWIIENSVISQKLYFYFKLRKLIKEYKIAMSKK